MAKETVLFLHGFLSSNNGIKAQYLREQFKTISHVEFHAFDFNPTPKDFEYMTVTGMINRLRQFTLQHNQSSISLIGSSLGSLVGLHFAHRFGMVKRLLLLAPVLFYRPIGTNEQELKLWQKKGASEILHYAFNEKVPLQYDFHVDGLQYAKPVPPPSHITIIHGRNDDSVPTDNSRDYAANYPDKVQLVKLDSDHLLNDQLDVIWKHVNSFLID